MRNRLARSSTCWALLLIGCTEPDRTPGAIEPHGASSFTGVVATTLADKPAVRVTTASGAPLDGVAVSFAVAEGGGSVQGAATTDGSGVARLAGWVLGTVAGLNVLHASVEGLNQTVAFTATALPGPPKRMAAHAGAQQSAQVTSAVGIRPAARVTDAHGNPTANVQVVFAVATGGGSITGAAQSTGVDGTATVGGWTLGASAGTQTLTATVAGLEGSPVVFTATATSGAATAVSAHAGDQQTGTAGAPVTTAPAVKVVDAYGNAVSGVTVTFAVASGGGTLAGTTQTTKADGVAAVGSWTLGAKAGVNTLTASAAGLQGSPVTFTATGSAGSVRTLTVAPDSVRLAISDTVRVTVTASDANGNTVTDAPVTFTVSDAAIASVSSTGLVTGNAPGTTTVMASVGSAADTAVVLVSAGAPDVGTDTTTGITSTSIDLRGAVTPRGDSAKAWFEWSSSASLAGATATSKVQLGASGYHGRSARVTGLQPATTYYYRALAESHAGTSTGAVVSATTSPASGRTLLSTSGISGAAGSSYRAEFDVPEGTTRLEVTTSGTYYAFLYVRFAAPAETSQADCYSLYVGSTVGGDLAQACAIDSPRAGRWYVLLYAPLAYTGLSLTATAYGLPEPVAISVTPGVDTQQVGGTRQFTATVTGTSNTSVTWTSSNTSVAEVTASGLATAKAVGQTTIRARSAADTSKSAAATLTVVAQTPGILTLANDVPITGLSGSGGQIQYFKFTVPQGAGLVAFRTLGGTGDVSMLIRRGDLPNDGQYDCRSSESPTTEEVCELTPATFNPTSRFFGDWYVYLINGLGAQFSDVKLVATWDSTSLNAVTTLTSGLSVTGLNDTTVLSFKHHFKIFVPPGATSLQVTASGSQVPDLYVEYKRQPLSTVSNFSCLADGTNKTAVACSFANPASGYWYIALKAFRKYTAVTLTATHQ